MASLGSIKSCALTGGDAPVFEGIKTLQKEVTKAKKSNAEIAEEQAKKIAVLTAQVEALVAASTAVEEVAEVKETPAKKTAAK